MAKKEKRFVVTQSQGLATAQVIVDRETGVNYLFYQNGYAGGLTPLLKADGTPVITSPAALMDAEK